MTEAAPRFAGFWIRLLAYLIDWLVVTFVLVLAMFSLGPLDRTQGLELQGASLVLNLVYYGVVQGALQGTLGKKALGLKLIRADGGEVTAGLGVLRCLASWLSALALCLGYLFIAWDPEKRSWHDRLAGTRVIREP